MLLSTSLLSVINHVYAIVLATINLNTKSATPSFTRFEDIMGAPKLTTPFQFGSSRSGVARTCYDQSMY